LIIVRWNQESLNRHGVAQQEVLEALADSMTRYFEPNKEYETYCEIGVGFTSSNRLIEFGISYLTNNEVSIFHAQSVSPEYKKLYEEEINA
jgi:hypothetical protein